MKRFLLASLVLLAFVIPASATSLGITPCSTQPADLSFSGVSANRQMGSCGNTVILFNNSTSDARFKVGTSASTAATLTDTFLPQKTFLVINVPFNSYVAVISSGSGTVSFIQGQAQ